jgi:methionine-rich copper-binding protein CopC
VGRALSLVAIPLLLAQLGLAQTQLIASNPQAGSVIHRNSIMFLLRFNKRVENAQCSLSLQTPAGENRTLTLQAQIASDQIQASGTDLGQGSYVLNWQVETPGKPTTRGAVNFSVH